MSCSDMSLLDHGIRVIGDGYRRHKWSPVEVVDAALRRIELFDPALHAWVLVDAERALRAAKQAEQELISGTDLGPLHGIPVGIKDIFDVAGWPTRCGSAARDDAGPATRNAWSVQALIDGGAARHHAPIGP